MKLAQPQFFSYIDLQQPATLSKSIPLFGVCVFHSVMLLGRYLFGCGESNKA